jgi:acetoin utilization deacetylase AcuC-like enzyme
LRRFASRLRAVGDEHAAPTDIHSCLLPSGDVAREASHASPSAGKPVEVVADWQHRALPIEIRSFEPVTHAMLELAHEASYVRDVLACNQTNGFGNRLPQVAASLPYTSGAMLAAAREALANGLVACAPVSGFHHANYAFGGGFCTFNGLMVTALVLQREGHVQRLGILDLDQHWGDGTANIIGTLGIDWVVHHSATVEAFDADDAEPYLQRLPQIVRSLETCDLLLYQAGADAHIDDPLGGWMNDDQLCRRDLTVFEIAREMSLPIAWNLAGGYRRDVRGGIEPVLAIHRRTMERCAAVFVC